VSAHAQSDKAMTKEMETAFAQVDNNGMLFKVDASAQVAEL